MKRRERFCRIAKMGSEFITFVVFVSVAHSVFVLSSVVSSKLSSEASATLDRIRSDEDATILEEFNGAKPIFNILRDLTAAIINDEKYENADFNATIAGAVLSLNKAIDYSLNAIYEVTGRPCAVVETARKEAHTNIDNGFAAIVSAIQVAQTGNYIENSDDIKAYGERAKDAFAPFWYESIRTCLNPDSRNDVENVIQMAENGSSATLNNTFDALIGAIEVYAAMVSDKSSYEGEAALVMIDSYRLVALEELLADIGYYFAILDALYLDSYLKRNEIVYELYVNRFNLKITSYKLTEVMEIVFTAIVDVLEKRTSVFEEDDTYYYPPANATEARARALLQVAEETFLDTIRITQPCSVAKIAAAKRVSTAPMMIQITAYYTLIATVQRNALNCHTQLATMRLTNDAQNRASVYMITRLFTLISENDARTAIERAPEASLRETAAIVDIQTTNDIIYNAIIFTDRIIRAGNGATQADFAVIRKYQGRATSSVTALSTDLYMANLEEVLASAGY